MKRLAVVVLVTVVAGVALATWGGAASAREANEAQKLPALPSNIKERGRFNIGIKCDSPPFGYIDVRGRNVGFDVEIARWFSRFAFGKSNRVNFTCLTTPAREPALTTDRVDMVIATFTYTADRDTRIDFSRAYYKATGTLLVPNSAPNNYLPTLAGKTIATTTGSIYDRWIKNCFKDTKLVVTDSFTNALLAFRDGRADALMWDDTVLVGIAAADRNLKLTSDTIPGTPVRHRDEAGQHRTQALGRLAPRGDAQAGHVQHDPQEQRSSTGVRRLPEEHPQAEQHVHVHTGRRDDSVPVTGIDCSTEGAAAQAAAPLTA